jgi:hypothetical protein
MAKVKLVRGLDAGRIHEGRTGQTVCGLALKVGQEIEIEGDLPEADEWFLLTIAQADLLQRKLSQVLDEVNGRIQ